MNGGQSHAYDQADGRHLRRVGKTLRHYDSIGLFSPLAVGEDNCYRYYGFEQLGMLRRIMWLRSLGVGLDTIQALKDSGDLHEDESLEPLLKEREAAIRGQMEELGKLLGKVEAMSERLQQSRKLRDGPRIVVKDAFTVVGLDWDARQLTEENGIPQLWERFLRRAHEIAGRVNPNELIGAGGPRESGVFGYIAGFETADAGAVPQGLTAVSVPACTYAVFELEWNHVREVRRPVRRSGRANRHSVIFLGSAEAQWSWPRSSSSMRKRFMPSSTGTAGKA
ncbi:effector binding domain-containing protein [Paenibacillus humicus]|uniref:effector binding domain-containing protein n=1 Tax=Paenibacillus humicus TaxID=412861 RepID=UPI003F13589C